MFRRRSLVVSISLLAVLLSTALGGQTPREAAGTSRRDDLAALLDDFAWQQRHATSPVAMDIPRLREELGLEG